MPENPDKPVRKNKTYNKKVFAIPLIICGIGFLICFISSLLSDNIDAAEEQALSCSAWGQAWRLMPWSKRNIV